VPLKRFSDALDPEIGTALAQCLVEEKMLSKLFVSSI
jgi:hypothetical protein